MSGSSGQPRGVVKINGDALDAWIEWQTEVTTFTGPSTFSVTLAMSALPQATNVDYFAAAEDLDVEIFVGRPTDAASFTASDLTSIFAGKSDDATADWVERTLTLTGRDLSAPLIDTKTSEKYINQTASQVAATLAGKYGLTPVITATSGNVGRFYKSDHVDLKSERTEWDLLTWLAREEGFRVYVKGRELHFEPEPTGNSGTPFALRREASGTRTEAGNYVAMRTARTLTVAGDIEVTVKSWNGKKNRTYTATAKRTGKSSGLQRGGGKKGKQKYRYTFPGLDQDGCQKKAQQLLGELSKHAMKLSFSGEGIDAFFITDSINLTGTDTAWDQTYHPDSIHREMSVEDGYSWSVEAKNHATSNEPTL